MVRTAISATELAKEAVALLSTKIPVDAAFLFGSYAYGSPHEDSDIDLAIISEAFSGMDAGERVRLLSMASLMIDSRLEVLSFTREEFHHPDKSSLAALIKDRGLRIN